MSPAERTHASLLTCQLSDNTPSTPLTTGGPTDTACCHTLIRIHQIILIPHHKRINNFQGYKRTSFKISSIDELNISGWMAWLCFWLEAGTTADRVIDYHTSINPSDSKADERRHEKQQHIDPFFHSVPSHQAPALFWMK